MFDLSKLQEGQEITSYHQISSAIRDDVPEMGIDDIDTDNESSIAASDVPLTATAPFLAPPTRAGPQPFPQRDQSTLLTSHNSNLRDCNTAEFAISMWCEINGISRPQFASLRQIMSNFCTPQNLQLADVPTTLRTLKSRLKTASPTIFKQKQQIVLNSDKLGSKNAGQKAADEAAGLNPRDHIQEMFFIDPID